MLFCCTWCPTEIASPLKLMICKEESDNMCFMGANVGKSSFSSNHQIPREVSYSISSALISLSRASRPDLPLFKNTLCNYSQIKRNHLTLILQLLEQKNGPSVVPVWHRAGWYWFVFTPVQMIHGKTTQSLDSNSLSLSFFIWAFI